MRETQDQDRDAANRLAGRTDQPERHDQLLAGSDLCVLLHLDFATSEDTKDVARRAIAAGIRTFWSITTEGSAPAASQ